MNRSLASFTTDQILEAILVERQVLYVRWSLGPDIDRNSTSRDWFTGELHAGNCLSANQLSYQELDEDSQTWRTNWDKTDELSPEAVEISLQEYAATNLLGRPWLMKAERIGTDSEGASLVDSRSFEPIGWWRDGLYASVMTRFRCSLGLALSDSESFRGHAIAATRLVNRLT